MRDETIFKKGQPELQPLLEIEKLRLKGSGLEVTGRISTIGSSLCCIGGAQQLVSALRTPQALLEGEVRVRGKPPQELLAYLGAGYVPQELPLPRETRLEDALLLSARLVGLGPNDVLATLQRCHMAGHKRKKLGELTRLQHRLSGLAHGLCGTPPLLILEDLFSDLEEAEASIVEAILEEELLERSWIAASNTESPQARRLIMSAEEVMSATGARLLPPLAPDRLCPGGFWVHCSDDARPLAALLRKDGSQVSESPKDAVLLVNGVSGLSIFQYARKAQITILELSPTSLETSKELPTFESPETR